MPSRVHQWLLVWAIRRMEKDGFQTEAFDNNLPQCDFNVALPSPFTFAGCRADAWGYSNRDALLAFVEAKTTADINRAHTRRQLLTLGNVRMRGSGVRCPLYLAIARSAVYDLDRALIDTGLIGARHVVRVHVPNALLEEDHHAARQASPQLSASSARRNSVPSGQ
jgi:hypothetical protein